MIRKLKILKNILVIIILVCFFLSISKPLYAVSVTGDVDLYNYYQEVEYQAQREYVSNLYRFIYNNNFIPSAFSNLAYDLKQNNRVAYFYNRNNGNLCARSSHYVNGESENEITVYVFNRSEFIINSDTYQAGVWFPGISSGNTNDLTYPCYRISAVKGQIMYYMPSTNGNQANYFYSNSGNYYYDTTVKSNIPRGTISYCPEFEELLISHYNGTLLDEVKNSNLWEMIQHIEGDVEETTENVEEMKDDVKAMKDYVTSTDKSVDTSLPSSSGANDPTSSGFNNIFMRFYNSMTSDSASDIITVPIPYADRSFDLNPLFIRSWWNSLGAINNMVSAVWFFLVGLYIAKDIHKIIHDIQDGSIMTKTDTDIKTEML